MSTLLKTFGNTIRNLRKAKGLSQESLAELCNLHRTYISGIELGKRNVSLINILILAKALGVPPSELLRAFDEEAMAKVEEKDSDTALP